MNVGTRGSRIRLPLLDLARQFLLPRVASHLCPRSLSLLLSRGFSVAALLVASITTAAPYRPTDPALELAHNLPPYRASLGSGIENLPAALAQAHLLINEGRRRADIRPFAYADRLLAKYAIQQSSNTELALLLADIHQYRHDFDGAVAILDGIIARDPRQSNARLSSTLLALPS